MPHTRQLVHFVHLDTLIHETPIDSGFAPFNWGELVTVVSAGSTVFSGLATVAIAAALKFAVWPHPIFIELAGFTALCGIVCVISLLVRWCLSSSSSSTSVKSETLEPLTSIQSNELVSSQPMQRVIPLVQRLQGTVASDQLPDQSIAIDLSLNKKGDWSKPKKILAYLQDPLKKAIQGFMEKNPDVLVYFGSMWRLYCGPMKGSSDTWVVYVDCGEGNLIQVPGIGLSGESWTIRDLKCALFQHFFKAGCQYGQDTFWDGGDEPSDDAIYELCTNNDQDDEISIHEAKVIMPTLLENEANQGCTITLPIEALEPTELDEACYGDGESEDLNVMNIQSY